MPANIELREVSFAFGPAPLLRQVSLAAQSGEIVLISGRSGCGLSTFLELCVGLQQPQSGCVLWDGCSLSSMSRERLLHERQGIGFMFQNCALISNFTVFDNIALPLRTHGRTGAAGIAKRVRFELEALSLVDCATSYPEALSVSQARTAALARALIGDPAMLFLDDPAGGMDQLAARHILDIIEERWRRLGTGIIMISHDPAPWPHLPVRRYTLDRGTLRPFGPALPEDREER